MTLWKHNRRWTGLTGVIVSTITLFLSCANLVTGQHLWSVAWLGVSLASTAHARLDQLERRLSAKDSPPAEVTADE